jgi:hypothetical protein
MCEGRGPSASSAPAFNLRTNLMAMTNQVALANPMALTAFSAVMRFPAE